MKILLYMVVLLSGVSILLRKDKAQTEDGGKVGYQITEHLPATLALGFVTGMIDQSVRQSVAAGAAGAGGHRVSLFPDVFQEYQQALSGEPGVPADDLPGERAA